MPFKPQQVMEQLQAKRDDFRQYDQAVFRLRQGYLHALESQSSLSPAELTERLPSGPAWLGARPLEPWQPSQGWTIPFSQQWQNREASKTWSRDRLANVTTIAVDGSQIVPSDDISIPVGVVQVGWFTNPHNPERPYVKDVKLELITPAELQAARQQYGKDQPARFKERWIHLRRFQLELSCIRDHLQQYHHCSDCCVFFDGSLVATFAESYDRPFQSQYIHALCHTLTTSRQSQVPLVSYIDQSQARDLVTLLHHLGELPATNQIFDIHLLAGLKEWGDRTPLFYCDRGGKEGSPGILADYGDWGRQIGFCYLKAHQGYPVRLEIPVWIYEMGWLERVIDWIRAEIMIGQGYPYAIEAADQTAVLQGGDRQAFLKLFQDWAGQNQLQVNFSRKWVSKQRRR
ncbi:DNA double-strand break repair nuclease NurA [Candidatus Synechococcus calcipolaris G9]|uniref:DNA double-strand break repair nuclease NurA n=1 Tax=Candidatus Synechococcus calcipolaris G9 TaxID=1497997 RepID=A0ABT6EZ15_9SYNE|nr:DNA double-strand break repair nuclease NurA [Candidatus Synechococcus calcipolaris]MDG2990618.1 DNA double-strand break repair nuclease NurA [Candidatus Synechococcus calcipolaris G9]